MTIKELQEQLARALATVRGLQEELAETNSGLIALTMELEQRVDQRTAELHAAHAELKKTNSELLQLTLELEDRVARRTRELSRANENLQAEMAERKRAEKEIRSLSKFPSENPHPVLRFAYDGTLLSANEGSRSLLQSWDCRVGRRAPAQWCEAITSVMDSGASREVEAVCGDVVYSLILVPVAAENYVNGYGRDVTERHRAEEALRASEDRFRRAVVDSPFPILLHAEDGEILNVSQSWYEITGYEAEELKTIADWMERAYGERKELVRAEIDALYGLDHRKYEGDHAIRTRRGETRIWEFSSAPLGRLSDGRRLVMSMAMDVTDRRNAEEEIRRLNAELEQRVIQRTAELQATNKELEAFSYSVSHDLRAPLRAVDGFAKILAEDHQDRLDAEGLRVLNVIGSETRRMRQLIDDLLTFSRMGRRQLESSDIDMAALVKDVFQELAAHAPERSLQFELKPLPKGQGDRAMIRQVWVNLLSNAIKFTKLRDRAAIEVGAGQEGGQTSYYVKDNGAGFDMKYEHKLFGIFQRLHSDLEYEGTGVGLALVQRIVHRHGGRVWAEGKINGGATFSFTLPDNRGKP